MTETELYKEIHDELKKICKPRRMNLHFVRLESPSSQGVPDINCCIDGKEFWIECKVNNNELNPMQISWQNYREMCGGITFTVNYNNDHNMAWSLYEIDKRKLLTTSCEEMLLCMLKLLGFML